ncbi:MAG: ribosome biogenesis GTPase Der [Chlamydiae bacterium]|nr:ribosome biogenesis GTPase Der [Chlamydiota bacterium]MBI3277430.1 ribosome biogenesis GTPase Der [Chlamydiota bacterium]
MMLKKNTIAIIGRPNVGKSTLFNRLVGHRISIVHEESGVTRDRVQTRCESNGLLFNLVDTGGVDLREKDSLHQQVREQVREALKEASLLLFTVDVQEGITSLDREVARWVRESGKKVFLVVNKVDNLNEELAAREFHQLGFEPVVMISATHGRGISELMDFVEEILEKPEKSDENKDQKVIPVVDAIKVSVVGKPNVGKSTLINHLFGKKRLIVDDAPGTTRDAVDVEIEIGGRPFVFVDTAGMRKRKQVRRGPETFSVMRALNSIRRADLSVLVLDGASGVSAQDVRILDEIRRGMKGCVLALNKWDLVKEAPEKEFSKMLVSRWKFLEIYPMIFCSALTGFRIENLIQKIIQVYDNARVRISEDDLDKFIHRAIEFRQPPSEQGHVPRFFSMTQDGVTPPQFSIQVNQANFVKESYRFFLEREFRKKFGFEGVPIQFTYKSKIKNQKSK